MLVGVLVAVLAGLLAGVTPSVAGAAGAPLSVTVSGNRLVDAAGSPVRLQGANRSGTEYACVQGWGIFSGPVDDAAIAVMTGWGITAVRVPLNQDCWLGVNGVSTTYGGAAYRSAIVGYVQRLHAAGLLAVLDLHWNAAGAARATDQALMADAERSPAFWSSVASTFRDDPAVMFDVYNEPHDISWACWRDGCTTSQGWRAAGMQSLVDAVRGTGARQPIILNGLGWGNDLSQWLAYRPVDPAGQLVAGVHVYNHSQCATAACWEREIAPVAAQVPVVTGEVGEVGCGAGFVNGYLDWADTRGVSVIGWTWTVFDCAQGQVAMITDYAGTPTVMGAALRDRFRRTTSSPSPSPSPTALPPLAVTLLSPSRAALGATGKHTVSVTNRSATAERRPLAIAFDGGPAQTVVSVSTPESSAWTCVLDTQARCTWSGGLLPAAVTPTMSVSSRFALTGVTKAQSVVRVQADGAVVTSASAETILG